jgi:xanthine dehydrogenase accessory factor
VSGVRIAAAVLAAGGSSRLGAPKQLLSIDGVPLVRRAVDAVCGAPVVAIAAVLGAVADDVQAALAGSAATLLHNPDWTLGLASSLHVAVSFAHEQGADALLVSVCDQPYLTPSHLARLCDTYRTTHGKVASGYADIRGVPAIFPRADFHALRALRGDRGASKLLRGDDVTVITWDEGRMDLDTRDDVARFTARAR